MSEPATSLREGGANISLGQRQLICIARAVLTDPRILILDKATVSIDTVTKLLIQKALVRRKSVGLSPLRIGNASAGP